MPIMVSLPRLSVLFIVLLAAPCARAGETAFVLSRAGAQPQDIALAVESALGALNRTLLRGELVLGEELRRRFGPNVERDASICEANAACLGRLGARLGAGSLAHARLTSSPSGTTLQVTLVEVGGGAPAKQSRVEIKTEAEVNQQIAAMASELFGVDRHMARGAIAAARKSPPKDDPFAVSEPPAKPRMVEAPLPPPAPVSRAVEVEVVREPPLWRTPAFWRYTGVGFAVVGVGLLGLGTVSAAEARSQERSVVYGAAGTTQLAAYEKQARADDLIHRANLSLLFGGLALGAGAAMLALQDVFVPEVAVGVSLGPSVSVAYDF